MKRIFLSLLLLAFFAYPAFAELEVQVDGTVVGGSFASQVNFTGDVTGSGDSSLKTIVIGSNEKSVQFGVNDFLLPDAVSSLSSSTQPGLETDNELLAIVWADGETTPAQVTFRVPQNYNSGGAFKVFVDESSSTTPNQVDFQVYVNTSGTSWDSSATGQTPVALAGTATTPTLVTLTPATDFDSLAAGDIVTLEVWRDNVVTAEGDLELYYGEFYFN